MIDPKKRTALTTDLLRRLIRGPRFFVNEVIDTIDELHDVLDAQDAVILIARDTLLKERRTARILFEMVKEYANTIDKLSIENGDLEAALRAAKHRIDSLERLSGEHLLYSGSKPHHSVI